MTADVESLMCATKKVEEEWGVEVVGFVHDGDQFTTKKYLIERVVRIIRGYARYATRHGGELLGGAAVEFLYVMVPDRD
jgi:hypothetical protein